MMRVKNHHMPATIRVEMALRRLLVTSSITLVLFPAVDLEKHPGYKGNSRMKQRSWSRPGQQIAESK